MIPLIVQIGRFIIECVFGIMILFGIYGAFNQDYVSNHKVMYGICLIVCSIIIILGFRLI